MGGAFAGEHHYGFEPSTKSPGGKTFVLGEVHNVRLSVLFKPGWLMYESVNRMYFGFAKDLKGRVEVREESAPIRRRSHLKHAASHRHGRPHRVIERHTTYKRDTRLAVYEAPGMEADTRSTVFYYILLLRQTDGTENAEEKVWTSEGWAIQKSDKIGSEVDGVIHMVSTAEEEKALFAYVGDQYHVTTLRIDIRPQGPRRGRGVEGRTFVYAGAAITEPLVSDFKTERPDTQHDGDDNLSTLDSPWRS
ncbi:hypothetical protein BCR34DRAFT_615226 [Clohesyomyces aquaticus]|uniref:Uncharacterized protein n=1 Tax=Clohesyomyces aquaticus TaxID=1231657 RepID=A0A1Y1ZJH7_9PLEO|nr:hypothetical protein BCR34DRAFT_615226 [Clohesyomyces aquaticus]